jgi:hypothetical protein
LIEELKERDLDCLVSGDLTIYSGRPLHVHLADTEAHRTDVYASSDCSTERSLRNSR